MFDETTRLLREGDDACVRHDERRLASVARQLAVFVGDPLRDELLALSLLCVQRRRKANLQWPALRAEVAERLLIAGT